MDYLITMDTGEKFLMHHGVKGMKWGVWNNDTVARYKADKIDTSGGGADEEDDEDKEKTEEEKQEEKDEGFRKYIQDNETELKRLGLWDSLPDEYKRPSIEEGTSYGEVVEQLTNQFIKDRMSDAQVAKERHEDDIRSGNISREEARLIGILNAVSTATTGDALIDNLKGRSMGVTYGQTKKHK